MVNLIQAKFNPVGLGAAGLNMIILFAPGVIRRSNMTQTHLKLLCDPEYVLSCADLQNILSGEKPPEDKVKRNEP